MLLSLASDARNFRGLPLRARTLARIGNALWEADPERGRELFWMAFRAGLAADEISHRKLREALRQSTEEDAYDSSPESVDEVMELAVDRDPALRKEMEKQLLRDPGNVSAVDIPVPESFNLGVEDVDRLFRKEPSEQDLLDRISDSNSSTERDRLYFDLSLRAARALDLKARDYVNKIEEPVLRKELRAFVDADLVIGAIVKKQTEKALQLIKSEGLTHLQRTWALARAARLLSKDDQREARALIEDALAESRRIEGKDANRPRALLAVAQALLIVDHSRGWDIAFEAVNAANSADEFTGEGGGLHLQITVSKYNSAAWRAAPDFDVEPMFRVLAREDYKRAIALARVFRDDAPRAGAVIAIARTLLNDSNTAVTDQ
jgi:hypothetical protein